MINNCLSIIITHTGLLCVPKHECLFLEILILKVRKTDFFCGLACAPSKQHSLRMAWVGWW